MTDTTPPSNAAVASDVTDHRVLMYIRARIGGKWAVLVVRALSGGTLRFNQLRRLTIGVSPRMLALTPIIEETGERRPRHEALTALLVEARKKAGLTQADVAKKLNRYQSYVATVESGQRRIDVVEFLDLTEAVGL